MEFDGWLWTRFNKCSSVCHRRPFRTTQVAPFSCIIRDQPGGNDAETVFCQGSWLQHPMDTLFHGHTFEETFKLEDNPLGNEQPVEIFKYRIDMETLPVFPCPCNVV